MKYINKKLKTYADDLAAKRPTPGGGSASALVGALGCSMLSMVANFTVSRGGYDGYKKRAAVALKGAEAIRNNFMLLVDKDVLAYERVAKAMKRHKSNTAKFQGALKNATVPLANVCLYAHKAAGVCLELAYVGNRSLISDVSVAISMLDAAFESAMATIEVNVGCISDAKYVSNIRHKHNALHADMKRIKTEVLSKLKERMSG